jgi:uncharacterized protein YydD (DUF2326 family)
MPKRINSLLFYSYYKQHYKGQKKNFFFGKTTVLRLIDFCLGGKKEKIYQDPEFKGRNEEGNKIKKFLEGEEVYSNICNLFFPEMIHSILNF